MELHSAPEAEKIVALVFAGILIAIVALDAAPKCVHRQVIHHLRKDKLALVHLPLPAARIAGGSLEVRRVQLKSVTG